MLNIKRKAPKPLWFGAIYWRRRPESNRRMADLQSAALPLGYVALIFNWKEGKETPGGPDKGQRPSLPETGARGYRYLPVPGWPDASRNRT